MQVIRAAQAFDGTRFLRDGVTVFIDEERIVGVEAGWSGVPDGVQVTEHSGTLLPGLIDCHTHLVADGTFGGLERAGTMSDDQLDTVITDSLRAHAVAGVTTVRDLGDRHYRTLAFRECPGLPRVVAAGPPITTPGGHCHFLGGVTDGDVRRAVADHRDHGVDLIKVMASGGFATPESDQAGAQFSVAELASLVEAAHAAGLRAVAHAHSLIGAENAFAAGVDGIEHFTCVTPAGLRMDDEFLDRLAARGVYIDLTMGNDRAVGATMSVPPTSMALLLKLTGFSSLDGFYESRLEALSRLRRHGVRLAPGVDSGMGPTKRHGSAWRMAGELVQAGYSVAEALGSVTSVAAEACGVAATTGRLATGYAADLLVVDGDLARDVALLARPREVLIRGTSVALP